MRRLTIVLMVVLLATLALSSVQAQTRRAVRDTVDMEITRTMGEVRARVADGAQPDGATDDGLFAYLWGVFDGIDDGEDNQQQPNSPGGDPGAPPWAGGPGGRPHDDDDDDGPPYGPPDPPNSDPGHSHGNGLPPGHSHGNSPVVGFPGHTHPPDTGPTPSEPY
jgi:type II secretory pathway pseudopilin PulG